MSERPNPGCSGTITSYFSASDLKNGSQIPAPRPPCRKRIGAPLPPRMTCTLQPATVSWASFGSLIANIPTYRASLRYLLVKYHMHITSSNTADCQAPERIRRLDALPGFWRMPTDTTVVGALEGWPPRSGRHVGTSESS